VKFLVVSDTHGEKEPLLEVMERHHKENVKIFHCGDYCIPAHTFPEITFAKGNCDRDEHVQEENLIEFDGLRILQLHGHRYKVKETSLKLQYRAMELGVNFVLFGHTHIPTCVMNKNILYLNPGSLLIPRFYSVPTYATVGISPAEDGERVKLEVEFFSLYGERQKGYGGVYYLPAINR
jgi:putative phosphoesterase